MKGIILAGGLGSRLHPLTSSISKQLLPVYKYPMIYYPINTLLELGINDILVITTLEHQNLFKQCLKHLTCANFSFIVQENPKGLAQAFILAEEWLDGSDVTLVLGDNIIINKPVKPHFYGYDNTTQNFISTASVQVVNISNNVIDAEFIDVVNKQNITFKKSGHYMITFMPEFYQASGTNKVITFWYQFNGVDVPFSNSRFTIINQEYFAPSITYYQEITNPATDNIRIMWYSDSTNTQIITITGLTSPARPSIPGVLISVIEVG
jgi:hypothetical protein